MTLKLDVSCCPGQWEVTVRRNAGPRCPSTSPPGPWRLIGQWEKRGAPMAPPVLLDVWHPPWCSYGCRGRCYGCRGPRELNKWAVGQVAGKRSTVRCRPPHLRHHPCPPPHLAPRRGASAQGKAGDSSTGCCQRRVLSTDVLSTQSSERGSSRDFLPDTRFTGEWSLRVCVCECPLSYVSGCLPILSSIASQPFWHMTFSVLFWFMGALQKRGRMNKRHIQTGKLKISAAEDI